MSYSVATSIYDNLTEDQRERLDFHLWSIDEERSINNNYPKVSNNSKNKFKNYQKKLTSKKSVVS